MVCLLWSNFSSGPHDSEKWQAVHSPTLLKRPRCASLWQASQRLPGDLRSAGRWQETQGFFQMYGITREQVQQAMDLSQQKAGGAEAPQSAPPPVTGAQP